MEEAVRAALSDLSSRDYLAPFHLHRFLHVLTVLFVYFVASVLFVYCVDSRAVEQGA